MRVVLLEMLLVAWGIFAIVLSIALKKNNRSKHNVLIGFLLVPVIIAAICAFYARFIEPNWIEITNIHVASKSFSPDVSKLKIIQLSDLHITKVGYREKSLIAKVNSLKPDIILITGDFISSEAGLAPCLEVLKQIRASKGMYAILGNTDYIFFYNENRLIDALKTAGVDVLTHDNRKIELGVGAKLWIAGMSYQYGGSEGVDRAFSGIPVNDPKILLIHVPEVADTQGIADYRPELILAGHTHGGQLGIPFIRKYSTYAERSKYMAGMFRVQGIPLYVNRGIGIKTRIMRFLCRPEVTVVHLENISD